MFRFIMRTTGLLIVPAMLLGLGLTAQPAQAQLARTFVSAAGGNDGNDCNRLTPCRTFQAAHDKTFDQGEITVLDAGGYGALTVTKTISIVNDGVGEAGVLVSGGATGITINAPATATVYLRGLTVQGIGFGGGTGLRFNSGAALTIEGCAFRNHTGNGVEFFPAATSQLVVGNTQLSENGTGSFTNGIAIVPVGSAITKVVLDRVSAYNNANVGVLVDGSRATGVLKTTVANSVAAGNGGVGFHVGSAPGHATASLMVVGSQAANNLIGLQANGSNTILRIGRSIVTGNTSAWTTANGGTVASYRDNQIAGNGDGNPAPTVIAKK